MGVSSVKWMKNMGMGIGNTTGGVALRVKSWCEPKICSVR